MSIQAFAFLVFLTITAEAQYYYPGQPVYRPGYFVNITGEVNGQLVRKQVEIEGAVTHTELNGRRVTIYAQPPIPMPFNGSKLMPVQQYAGQMASAMMAKGQIRRDMERERMQQDRSASSISSTNINPNAASQNGMYSTPTDKYPKGVQYHMPAESNVPGVTSAPSEGYEISKDLEDYLNNGSVGTALRYDGQVRAMAARRLDETNRILNLPPKERARIQRNEIAQRFCAQIEDVKSSLKANPNFLNESQFWGRLVAEINAARLAFISLPKAPELAPLSMSQSEADQMTRSYEACVQILRKTDPYKANGISDSSIPESNEVILRADKVSKALRIIAQLPLDF